MAAEKFPVTPAIRALRAAGVVFTQHLYDYEEHGGTARAAAELGVEEARVIKTLVLEDETGRPWILLQHGDREAAVGLLARAVGVKRLKLCDAAIAQKHTGYLVGGTSPLGTRTPIPVCVERTILELPELYVNGGKRGFLVRMEPGALREVLTLREVEAAA